MDAFTGGDVRRDQLHGGKYDGLGGIRMNCTGRTAAQHRRFDAEGCGRSLDCRMAHAELSTIFGWEKNVVGGRNRSQDSCDQRSVREIYTDGSEAGEGTSFRRRS